MSTERHVAISLVEINSKWALRADGTGGACVVLTVWSEVLNGWILPTGAVGDKETPAQAQARTLVHTAGLPTVASEEVWRGDVEGESIHLFRVQTMDDAIENAVGVEGKVKWIKHEELLKDSPHAELYELAFRESW